MYLKKLLDLHAQLTEENPHCYFELARTRTTDWMAWICSDCKECNPDRVILAKGQGGTPEDAAKAALESFFIRPGAAKCDHCDQAATRMGTDGRLSCADCD